MFFKSFPLDVVEGFFNRKVSANTPADLGILLKNLWTDEFRYSYDISKEDFIRMVNNAKRNAEEEAPVYYKIGITKLEFSKFRFEKKIPWFFFVYSAYGGRGMPYFVVSVSDLLNGCVVDLKYELLGSEMLALCLMSVPFLGALSFSIGAGRVTSGLLFSLVFLLLTILYKLKCAHAKLALKADFEKMFGPSKAD